MSEHLAALAVEQMAQALKLLGVKETTITVTHTVTASLTPRERLERLPPDRLVSVREASDLSGRSVTAIQKLVQRGSLPARRMKGRKHSPVAGPPLLVRAGDLRAYLHPTE
jgi:hypothetical protein